jgi:hypothetical protein
MSRLLVKEPPALEWERTVSGLTAWLARRVASAESVWGARQPAGEAA